MRVPCLGALIAAAFVWLDPVAADASCQVVGDSIAVGAASVLHGCSASAKVGISTTAIRGSVGPADWLIISAGSNDYAVPALRKRLEAIRSRAKGRVIWILPAIARARVAVASVAGAHGDRTVGFAAGRDGVHPRSYPTLGTAILAIIGVGRSK